MRRTFGIIISAAMIGAMFAIPQSAGAVCTTRGAKAVANPSVTQGEVDNRQSDVYKVVVPKGQQGYIHAAFFTGDIDMTVCKVSTAKRTKVVCYSHNMAALGDGCHAQEASIPLPEPVWNPDTYLVEWGPPLGPGTYRVTLKHCFSSRDGEGCDYTDDPVGLGDPASAPGALDDAPAIPYLLAFATQ